MKQERLPNIRTPIRKKGETAYPGRNNPWPHSNSAQELCVDIRVTESQKKRPDDSQSDDDEHSLSKYPTLQEVLANSSNNDRYQFQSMDHLPQQRYRRNEQKVMESRIRQIENRVYGLRHNASQQVQGGQDRS